MFPKGMDPGQANAKLQEISQQCRRELKDVPHDGVTLRNMISERWHKECGAEYEGPPVPIYPAEPPPPALASVSPPVAAVEAMTEPEKPDSGHAAEEMPARRGRVRRTA